jgi:acyl carrier protein phosphodiesterase
MNYLAHAYLSFHHPGIMTGNMISDFVKGKKKDDYTPDIQKGITLHRLIDRFTDEHTATKRAREVFRPAYRLYSGAFVDIVYDHFLAADENEFSNGRLARFAEEVYAVLDSFFPVLPEKFQKMLPYLKSQNWLYNYRLRLGIEKSFGGLVRRAEYLTESDTAYSLFTENYEELKTCYQIFMPDVKKIAQAEFDTLVAEENNR